MDSLKNKKILVTGGKGYLGSRLVKSLENQGAEVFQISLETPEHDREYQIDICNPQQVKDIVENIQPNIIYHLAASLDRRRDFDNYEKVMKINVDGTLNLLRALENIDYENLIFTSSSEVYGNNQSPFHENLPLKATSPYSLSKVYGEHLIQTFSDIHNKNYTIMRIFNFYGENMSESFFIPQMIQTLKRDEDFKMTEGEQARDFLYVNDVVNGLVLAATNENAKKEIFNICSGYGTSMKMLAQEIEKRVESKGKVLYGAIPYRENEIWEMIGDNSKIKEKLNFNIQTTLEEGIAKCLEK